MPKNAVRALLTAILCGLAVIVSAIALTGPSSSAAPTRSAATFAPAAAPSRPCGKPHYPPCPKGLAISVSPKTVRRGHSIFVSVRHAVPGRHVTVHLAGHGRYIFLGSTTVGRHGNANVSGRIPKHIPTGGYTVYVQVGSTIRSFHLNVVRG
jgi:hypothetical protein